MEENKKKLTLCQRNEKLTKIVMLTDFREVSVDFFQEYNCIVLQNFLNYLQFFLKTVSQIPIQIQLNFS